MPRVHTWDNDDNAPHIPMRVGHTWEDDTESDSDRAGSDVDDSDVDLEKDATIHQAACEALAMLESLTESGNMHKTTCCHLCFWLHRMGHDEFKCKA